MSGPDAYPARIAVMGAGLIGRRHIQHVRAEPETELAAVVDPTEAGRQVAADNGVPWYASFREMLAAGRPDGVVIATPNQVHVENGLEAVAAGVPILVEKPIADDLEEGERLVAAAEGAGVPLLVGHHRRHNPIMRAAREIVASGRLGRIVTVNALFWLYKPDDYFDVAWRREPGAGPVFLNLIHDIDNLRALLGEVVAIQAAESNTVRGHGVEETSAIILEFASGALGTVSVCDTVVAPWSWEMTTGENPAYPLADEACYVIAGTAGSLSLPKLEVWTNDGKPGWWEPLQRTRVGVAAKDPLALQIRHFAAVIRGDEPPLVSGREGLRTLEVVTAIKQAARTGLRTTLPVA
ncbi:Gfo/Idh/MocA family oxidoreductase [Aureimonas sp. SK2]|uniref:Gfo/Idh/MocA family protein n=1 Tax=Aureimonas sp. SK2 TaxID=3015992 RepID=UPI002444890F|nr:Gfo/Idh/MocA family oxidoreductase [Aureimonas sp. SK2]